MTSRAIETTYSGVKFRSRLEARWAVFFDSLNIEWVYEPEGFEKTIDRGGDVEETVRYLPDFFLPKLNLWVEVKGSLSESDSYKMAIILDWGSPLKGFDYCEGESTGGLLILGDVPTQSDNLVLHKVITHEKGLHARRGYFENSFTGFRFERVGKDTALIIDLISGEDLNGEYDAFGDAFGDIPNKFFEPSTVVIPAKKHYTKVKQAYAKARSARFEFGQTP